MQNSIEISIIIVNYKVEKELIACIRSIKAFRTRTKYEIIVVDNDEIKTIEKKLKKIFPEVIYLPNPQNNGWGGGVNYGAKVARGKYLYFLNPDTLLLSNVLDISIDFFQKHSLVGIVSSLLFDKNKKAYPMQGTEELTPFRGAIVYSFINRIFPDNPISVSFFCRRIKRTEPFRVEITTLTAAMIQSKVFRSVGMFDTSLFLYFEEYDLGRRVNKLNLENYILPDAKVLHFWESSTKQINNRNHILEKSRYYYFTKHFGKLKAKIVEAILRRNLGMLVVE